MAHVKHQDARMTSYQQSDLNFRRHHVSLLHKRQLNHVLYILFIILVLIILPSCHAVRWRDENCRNPNSKRKCFCSGTQNGRSMAGSANRFQDLKIMYENCTRVYGNLEITHLTKEILGWNDTEMNSHITIFDHIEEIKGYLLIYNVDLPVLSFKNLKIIWGDELLDENSRNGAMTVTSNHKLAEIHMPKLRTIEKGNVRLENNTFLCYLRDKILWEEILNLDKTRFISISNDKLCEEKKSLIVCHKSCESGHCWSGLPGLCQKLYRTVCPSSCHSSKQCFWNETSANHECCDPTCTGGCKGPTANDCLACREFSNKGVCVSKCPELMVYDRRTGTRVPNPNGTYIQDRYCVDKCPEQLLIDGEICVRHCSIGKHHDMTKETRECEKCKGPCPKVCNVDKPLTGSILRNLTNCEEIDGFIAILDSKMSSRDGFSVDDLKVLKTVRMVSEYVMISSLNLSPQNLGFLGNLEFIEGRRLSNRRYALEITKNDNLMSLDLKNLKTIKNGNVIIADNNALCYVSSVNWTRILVQKHAFAHVSKNRDLNLCTSRSHVCDSECDSSAGCWAKGPGKCLKCKNWSLEGVCVAKCPEQGYYRNITSFSCLPCSENCLECLGPSETECKSCRNMTMYDPEGETLQCLKECPITHFVQNSTCFPCDQSCQEFGCTGPRNILGAGGCNRCSFALLNKERLIERCLWGSETNICQENNLTNYFGALSPKIDGVEKAYCEPCHDQCSTCRSGGNSIKTDECKCKNFLVKLRNDQSCRDTCPVASYLSRDKTDKRYGICEECHQGCDRNHGCSGGTERDCVQCAKASIEEDGVTICLETCPENAPYLFERKCHRIDVMMQKRQRQLFTVSLLVIIFIILIGSVLFITYKCRRIKLRLKKEIYEHAPNVPEMVPMDASHKPNMSQLRVIPVSDIHSKQKRLGEGAFGVVYAGYYYLKGRDKKQKLPVAIKLLKSAGKVVPQEEIEMMEEAATMARLRHPNLLGLIGTCFREDGVQLITPLRPLGNLSDFLKKHKNYLAGKDLLSYCYQVASAMKYLYDNRVVHRDLAARNVLVKNPQHVQVTDFGLSKLLKYGEKEVEIGGKVAYKWSALESLTTHCFNHATDVWAFGVTCWEILTFGQSPYPGMNPNSMLKYIKDGNRLSQPKNCSIELYQNLLQCWVPNPDSRPTFVLLEERFEEFCRVPHLYVVLEGAASSMNVETDQMAMISDLFKDCEDSEISDDHILNPESYQDSDMISDNFEAPSSRTGRRHTSTGSKRYQPDPVKLPNQMESEDDGNYLIPTAKTREQEAATLYTAVIVNKNGEAELVNHDYYNEMNSKYDAYYNCKTMPIDEKVKEEGGVEMESCL